MANRLRVIRAEHRVSQLRVALRAQVHPTRFWRIENDIVEPTDEERARIAEALSESIPRIWPDTAAAELGAAS
jgi:transcriptional regulator with XRE-family HTH domain